MPTFNTEFTRDPVKFMSTHAVAMNYGSIGPGRHDFVFERDDADSPMLLRLATAGDADKFNAYFLPYADNATFAIQLGSAANYMFTPPMTGCSFFLGNKWWSPEVAHINYQTATGAIDQATIDADPVALRITASGYSVKKDDYVPTGESGNDHRLIVFGVRAALGWYLYRTKHDPFDGRVSEAPTRIN